MKAILPKRLITTAVAVISIALLAIGTTAFAIGEGQIEGGDIYRIKNVTKSTGFSDPATAEPCDTVQYKVRLHNPGPGVVDNVTVKTDLPASAIATNVSTITVTAQNAQPASRTDTATLNISSAQKVSYLGGSTELLDTNNNFIRGLPDGITGGGINIGSVGVSLNEIKYVQFKAKIECPTPPPKPSTGVCKELNTQITDQKQREVKATVTGEVNNAQIVGYKIDFGDGTVIGQQSATHQYTKDGSFSIIGYVQVKFADGHIEWKTASACASTVKFEKEKPPIVTPPQEVPPTTQPPTQPSVTTVAGPTITSAAPATLPSTGPSGVAAIVIGVSTLSALGHRLYMKRRFMEG